MNSYPVIASATKQSSFLMYLDCFVASAPRNDECSNNIC